MAMRMAELDGAEPPAPHDAAAFEARVASLAADFVEPAKSKAYNELGDGRRAQAIAASWLRAGALAERGSPPTRDEQIVRRVASARLPWTAVT